jgi:hypothetical protein
MSIRNIIENYPELVNDFMNGQGSYDIDEIIWDYYYDKGVIRNYNNTDVSDLYKLFAEEVADEIYALNKESV